MPDVELQGVVVVQDQNNSLPFEPQPHDGLYLQTDDGRLLELIGNSATTQMPIDVMWRRSRKKFEFFLDKRVTVQGNLNRRTLYSARVTDPLPDNSFDGP